MFEVLFKPYNEGEERKGHMKEKRRMISEAARQLGLETYHLRTWEEVIFLNDSYEMKKDIVVMEIKKYIHLNRSVI